MLYLNFVEKDKLLLMPNGIIDNSTTIITLEQMQTHGGKSIKFSVNAPFETKVFAVFADPHKSFTKRGNATQLVMDPVCSQCGSRTHKVDCTALTYRR